MLIEGGHPLTEDMRGRSGDEDEPEAETRNEEAERLNDETGNEVPKSLFPVADELSVFYCKEGCFRSGLIVQRVRNIVKCRVHQIYRF